AKRGARVLGIDRYWPPHALGSSHGDSRITRLAIGEGAQYTPLVLRANEIWGEIERETGETLHVVTGGLIISSPARSATTHVPHFFENTLAAAKRFGIEHEVPDAAAIRARFPQFAVRDNEVGYYEPGAGYLRPERCIAAQLTLAQARGATLHFGERVEAFEDMGDHVVITTDRDQYKAGQAIVSAGAWLPQLLEADLASRLAVTRQVLYWFEPRGAIEEFEAPRFPIWIWELQETKHVIYGFPAIDGQGGGVKLATEQYAATTTPDTVEREVSDEEKRAMHRDLVAPYLPGIGPRCVKALACLYTATPDFQFLIERHPTKPNVIVASPCSGHGFKHSAAIGEVLAHMIKNV
ncbi:MAG: N-methyl-L-tryptophan oxidase, partial [Burkholderiales bacterium]|nr:N-methyl-L-tryptophan oxidase [Burkholderiales bacterium]